MKYPWVAVSMIGIWLGTSIAIYFRPDLEPERLIVIAMATTIFVALVGFRLPKVSGPPGS